MTLKDVVVVGSGPAGTTLAQLLAKAGLNVLIIEKNESPGKNKVCGGAISKSFFDQLCLPQTIVKNEIYTLVVHFPKKTLEIPSTEGFVLVDRQEFDSALAQRATDSGSELITSSVVLDGSRDNDEVSFRCKNSISGEVDLLRGRLAVFADGSNTLGRLFGIGFEANPNSVALAAAYEVKQKERDDNVMDFFVSEDISPFGYGWRFPKETSINLGVTCLLSKIDYNIRDSLDKLLLSCKMNKADVIKFGCRLIPQSPAQKIFGEKALAVGDSAGTADPITGGGISNAIENAKIAAETVLEAFRVNDMSEEFLSHYASKWMETQNYKRIISKQRFQNLSLEVDFNPCFGVTFGAFTGRQ